MSIPNDIIGSANVAYLGDPFEQYCGLNGKPLIGGWIETYLAGTSDKYITFQDFDGNYNPFKVPLGSDGRVVMLADPSLTYDMYVKNSYGDLVCSRLNVQCNVPGNISIKGADTRIKNTDGTLDISLQTMGNNVREYTVNTRNKLLDVQSPLYFVENSPTATVIGIEGGSSGHVTKDYVNAAVSGKLDTTAFSTVSGDFLTDKFEFDDNFNITGYDGSAFAGKEYNAGDYVSIENDTISVTGLQPSGNYATQDDLNSKLDTTAFSNVSGTFLTAHQSLDGYATEDWVENQGYLTAHQDLSNYATKSFVESAVSGKQDKLTAGEGIQIVDNTISVTAQGGSGITAVNHNSTLSGNGNDVPLGITNAEDFVKQDDLDDYATTADLSNKLDTTAFSNVSGTFLTAHQDLSDYATTADLASKLDTTAFSTVSSDFLTAHQDLSDYATTASVAEKLDTTAFSTVSGDFLTAVDLTPYQTTAGMTAYATVESLTSKQDAGNYYSASNPSGFISEVPDTYLQNTDLTIVDNKITEISGVPLSAGDELPAIVSAATDYVTATSADLNSTINNVSANSGVWGGSALPISAGQGIKLEIVNDTLVASTEYSAGANIDITDNVISGKSWTDEIDAKQDILSDQQISNINNAMMTSAIQFVSTSAEAITGTAGVIYVVTGTGA